MTAGYPQLDDTLTIIKELERNGADLVEIGMPFSDPLADGPLLQQCNQQALYNGMGLEVLFNQLQNIRKEVRLPLILMGYLNPVLNYGFGKFCEKASSIGIDGLILPDLPIEEYIRDYRETCEKQGLHMVFLITPQTSNERILMIDELSRGFIYLVSAASTTGARDGFLPEQVEYFRRISEMKLESPTLIGFGISNHATFSEACSHANGAIIGSAFMKSLAGEGDISGKVKAFTSSILQGNA
jgi:tryptophan synthase alpha chain